jgi:adenylate kinase
LERLSARGRGDDDPQALGQRWQEFEQRTQPVIDYYRQRNLLSEVDGLGTVEAVAGRLAEVI